MRMTINVRSTFDLPSLVYCQGSSYTILDDTEFEGENNHSCVLDKPLVERFELTFWWALGV